jgi:hypothetical protein
MSEYKDWTKRSSTLVQEDTSALLEARLEVDHCHRRYIQEFFSDVLKTTISHTGFHGIWTLSIVRYSKEHDVSEAV